ncbi:MAG: hypothetical protein H7A38_03840 [Chlamydiales bacterium]|nr:hypothetical protein [Chlamydiales bacterium]
MASVYETTAMDAGTARFAPGCPYPNDTTWFVGAEVLYWHGKSGGTEYAIAFDSASLPQSGNVKDVDFEWDLGFRFGLGRFIGCERRWDINLEYTHFYNHDTESTSEPNDSIIFSNGIDSTIEGVSHAKFDGNLDYDALDLMLGKGMFMSPRVTVHPKIGLKAAWLDQRYKFHADDRIDALQTELFVRGNVIHSLKSSCDFFGLGPRIGTDMRWYLGDGFRLFADASATLFYSSADVKLKNRVLFQPDGSAEQEAKISLKGDKHLFCPQVAFFGGLLWGRNFHLKNSEQYLEFGVGYEVQYFWRVNQILDISDVQPALSASGTQRVDYKRSSEDVSFYGITFKGRFDF